MCQSTCIVFIICQQLQEILLKQQNTVNVQKQFHATEEVHLPRQGKENQYAMRIEVIIRNRNVNQNYSNLNNNKVCSYLAPVIFLTGLLRNHRNAYVQVTMSPNFVCVLSVKSGVDPSFFRPVVTFSAQPPSEAEKFMPPQLLSIINNDRGSN